MSVSNPTSSLEEMNYIFPRCCQLLLNFNSSSLPVSLHLDRNNTCHHDRHFAAERPVIPQQSIMEICGIPPGMDPAAEISTGLSQLTLLVIFCSDCFLPSRSINFSLMSSNSVSFWLKVEAGGKSCLPRGKAEQQKHKAFQHDHSNRVSQNRCMSLKVYIIHPHCRLSLTEKKEAHSNVTKPEEQWRFGLAQSQINKAGETWQCPVCTQTYINALY